MLVISRKRGEVLMIGDDIEVEILAIQGSEVRLGFRAPHDTSIHREEVYARIHGSATPPKVNAQELNARRRPRRARRDRAIVAAAGSVT